MVYPCNRLSLEWGVGRSRHVSINYYYSAAFHVLVLRFNGNRNYHALNLNRVKYNWCNSCHFTIISYKLQNFVNANCYEIVCFQFTNLIMRIDVRRRQRRWELPQGLLAESKRIGRLLRCGGLEHGFSRVHWSWVLLSLAQLAVDDTNRHHSTVIPNHGIKSSHTRITKHTGLDHRQKVPVGQSQHFTILLTAVSRSERRV